MIRIFIGFDSKAVLVAMHDYKTMATRKYLGAKNQDYPRKNGSSVMLWNCAHPDNRVLTPGFVERATGADLQHEPDPSLLRR